MKKISNLNRYLSAYLRNWLKNSGLSQTEAAWLLKIDQAQLNGLLNLTRGISLEKLESLALATGKQAIDGNLSSSTRPPVFTEYTENGREIKSAFVDSE